MALCEVLQAHFSWNLARLKCVSGFIMAVLILNTVNLSKLSSGLNGLAKRASNYRRLQRFFKEFDLDQKQVADVIFAFISDKGPFLVSMDRTNWKLGQFNINILMVGIIWHDIVIPLSWTLLDKRGNSHTDERKGLMDKLLKVISRDQIKAVVADREFIGADWFYYLEQKRLAYAIRIKENAVLLTGQGKKPIRYLFRDLAIGDQRLLRKKRFIYSHQVYLSCIRLSATELLIVASAQKSPDTLAIYKQRWGIEVLFAAFKSRGFDLEKTHMTNQDKLEKLISLLALAMTWAFLVGLWQAKQKAIAIKKHGRKAISLFRSGLDQLQFVLMNYKYKWRRFYALLELIREPVVNHV